MTSAPMEGEPRIVSRHHLGSTAEVMAKLAGTSAGEPLRTWHKKFGDLAAAQGMVERLAVVAPLRRSRRRARTRPPRGNYS